MRPFSIAVFAAFTLSSIAFAARPVTVDDEMKFRSIVDVKIAPDGERVAYVVSTPNLPKDEHEGALYVVSARGGRPKRLTNLPRPDPDRLARGYLDQAGFQAGDLDTVLPLLRAAQNNTTFERQFKGTISPGAWTP